MSVTLTLMPSPIIRRMAGRPSIVAGILIITLGRSTRRRSSRAADSVPAVSRAKVGETSTETNPSRPSVAVWSGAKASQAARMSSTTMVQYAGSTPAPAAMRPANCSS
jgi:hypothetical protein